MVATDRPRFKQELVAEPIEDGGARFIDLMDPDSGNVFRFYEVEYALACAMDGERDVAGIVRWAQEELGLSPSPKEVQTVIATLGDLGYLDARPAAETHAPAPVVETAPTAPTAPAKVNAKVEAKHDDDLGRGVIVGKHAPVASIAGEDYELGASGGFVPTKQADLPAGGDLALGAAGTTAPAKRADPITADDIKLGASGATADQSAVPVKSDLSMDLSSDFALNPSDVKEAVRASKVMTAVEVPQDILDTLDQKPEPKKPEPKVEAKKPEPKVEVKAEAKKVDAKADTKKKNDVPTDKLPDKKVVAAAAEKVDAKKAADAKAKPADAKAKPADAKKVEPKKATAVEEKKPVTPPAPKPGVSPVLIVLLVLAVIGAGIFLVWKYVLDKPAAETSEVAPPVTPVKKEPPPPPPAPVAKLALDTPAPVDIKSAVVGTVEWIEANDKVVKTGDVIAKLAGQAPIQAALDGLKKDVDKGPAAVDAAQKELDAAKDDATKAAAQTKLDAAKKAQDTRQQALTAKQADLDKLLVKSPADGKLAVIAKANAKLAVADVVAKVTQEPMLAAVFTAAPGGKYVAGSPATLGLKGTDKKLSCTVADVVGDQVKVICTADASIPASADVTLE